MQALVGFLSLGVIGWFIYGLIRPEKAMWWNESTSRGKLTLWFVGIMVVLGGAASAVTNQEATSPQQATQTEQQSQSTQGSEQAPQQEETTWQTVERFSGSGQTNTSPFTIEANEWRVRYTSEATSAEGRGHIFQLSLYEPGADLPTEMVANVANEERVSNESYVYDSGRFYFQVNAANGRWEIAIQAPN